MDMEQEDKGGCVRQQLDYMQTRSDQILEPVAESVGNNNSLLSTIYIPNKYSPFQYHR